MNDISETWKAEQGKIVICREQDVQPYLEANRRRQRDFSRSKGGLRMVANIPNVVVEKWMSEGVNIFDRNHAKEVQRRLNSNEYAYLRTSPGKMKVT